MARVHFVKKAQKDDKEQGIKRGDSYYWWKFRYGGKIKSKTEPKPQQLTQSAYQIMLYDMADIISELNPENGVDSITEALDNLKQMIEDSREECEQSLENIPEQLRDSSGAGCTLTERIEELENWHRELEGIEVEDGDEELLQNTIEEIQGVGI